MNDLVSKFDVIGHIKEQYIQHNELVPSWLTIGDMPATHPKKGRWIDECGGVRCSVCGHYIDDDFYAGKYCSNCGAKMEVDDEIDD